MRRSGHPSRPKAITCCFLASVKTLLISTKATRLTPKSTSRASFSLAGFQVTLIGRLWVTPEVQATRFYLNPPLAEIPGYPAYCSSAHCARHLGLDWSTHISPSILQHPALHSAEQDAQLLPIHRLLKKESCSYRE